MKSKTLLLTLAALFGIMQATAETWTDSNGITWSFTVNGTEATDIRFSDAPSFEKIYIYGDPNRDPSEEPQPPFKPGVYDDGAMRFSSTEGKHLPTIPDEVYFGLKTLLFDVSDVTDNFDLKVMNGWWSNTYYDHVKWVDGVNELQITQTMADECAKGGEGRDLDLMLYSGSMLLKSVYYKTISTSETVIQIPEKVYVGSTELTVTSIGKYAFYNSSSLTSVTIPNSVISIGKGAFQGCSSLTSVTIPNSVTSIGNWAFYCCSSLTSVTIPISVTSIGESAFYGCSKLTSIEIPNSVTTISDNTFGGCTSLTSVTIPNSVTSIGFGAFSACSGLTSVTIPNSVTSIRNWAFYCCSSLTSVTIPNSVTSIENRAFRDCSSLTSVTIPNSVISIGQGAFQGCSSLTSVTIPNSVISIGSDAFHDCSGLTSVTIPNSVISIGWDAFQGCSGLTSISVESGNTKYDSRGNCNAIIETASNWLIAGCMTTVIPNSVTLIDSSAFFGCSSLTSIIIPNSVTTIGEYAFYGCSGLTSITIPNSVTYIGDGAFSFTNNEGKLVEITSLIKEPMDIDETVFSEGLYSNASLYVPIGTIDKYKEKTGWKKFIWIKESTTGINDIKQETTTVSRYYDLNGQETSQPRKGINIVKMSDGKTKKVLVK